MAKTSIEWTQFSINPLKARVIETGRVGHHCEKISPGCKNCYASKLQKPLLTQLAYIAENRQKIEYFLDEATLQQVLGRRKPTEYFWCDMTDMFLDDYPDYWIDKCFSVMALTPHHTHMVLTKRATRMREYLSSDERNMAAMMAEDALFQSLTGSATMGHRWPLKNVRLGVSVEDRVRKERIEHLRQTPAAVRFISFEPLLEDLGELDLTGISWAIWGGESGPGARRLDSQWIRNGMEQARQYGTRNFVKQFGANVVDRSQGLDDWGNGAQGEAGNWRPVLLDRKGGNIEEFPEWAKVREFPNA